MDVSTKQGNAAYGRVNALDAVRGLALCMVLSYHYFSIDKQLVGPDTGLLVKLSLAVVHSNWLSLHLFFVLSGYLITGILIRSRETPNYYKNFYMRRVLRILPPYYLLIAFVFLVYPLFNQVLRESSTIHEWPWLLAHVQNLRVAWTGPYEWQGIGHFWSLGVEEQFYLFWPMLIAAVPLRRLPLVCAAIFFGSAGLRLSLTLADVRFSTIYVFTLTNLDGLAAGSWVAAVTALAPQSPRRQMLGVSAAGIFGVLGLGAIFVRYYGVNVYAPWVLVSAIPLMALVSAALIYRIHHRRMGAWGEAFFSIPLLVWLGRYSYGMYLIHAIVMPQLYTYVMGLPDPWWAAHPYARILYFGLLDLLITVPAAWLMFRYVEAPAMRYARRFAPEVKRTVVDAAPA